MEVAMWKAVLAGTTALTIAGSSLVFAQDRAGDGDKAQRWRPSAEDMSVIFDARVSAFKSALKLTPDQEKLWPAVETAVRDIAKERMQRRADRREARRQDDGKRDPIERLRQRADTMSERAADLKKIADAVEPLYKSLDDGQKRRFTMLARTLGPRMALAGFGGARGDHRHHGDHHRR
jgi:zinc resistance-associated protein